MTAQFLPGTFLVTPSTHAVWVVDRDRWVRLARWGYSRRLRNNSWGGDAPVDLAPEAAARFVQSRRIYVHGATEQIREQGLALLDYVMGRTALCGEVCEAMEGRPTCQRQPHADRAATWPRVHRAVVDGEALSWFPAEPGTHIEWVRGTPAPRHWLEV